jgi:hypothetical protein
MPDSEKFYQQKHRVKEKYQKNILPKNSWNNCPQMMMMKAA